ncbi:hypothetical protein [Streptacidiphilus sp. EB129]|uniref:hypothetical protein n=1 Tax=Streptacidiphilus sp. EB129 TaxID=3156262 RepID=UPI0035112D16
MDRDDAAPDDRPLADEVVWAWLTGCPVRGGTVKQQLVALNRMFQDGVLTLAEFAQAEARLASGAPRRLTRCRPRQRPKSA